jgi:hypothetical protein
MSITSVEQTGTGLQRTQERDLIAKEFIVEVPSLQVGDRRCLGFLVRSMDHPQAEKIRPCGFEVGLRIRVKPDLMLVSLVVWRAA